MRLSRRDLDAPFHGVRVRAGASLDDRLRIVAYAKRMPQPQFFSHATAAMIHGIPLPLAVQRRTTLDVAVVRGDHPPSARGVIPHVLEASACRVIGVGGLRVTDPRTTWRVLGALLGLDDLIAATDALITGAAPIGGTLPLCTRDDLDAELRSSRGHRGVVRLRAALEAAREGSVSRQETFTRLALTRGGLPDPELNHPVVVRGRRIAVLDLAYPDHRVGIEYQSDFHTTPQRYRADLARLERLADLGWLMVQVTARDLATPASRAALVRRVAARLASRASR